MEYKNDIGNLLKKRLENESSAPATQLWDRINTSLDKYEENKSKLHRYRLTGGTIIAVIAITIFIFFANKNTTKHLKKTETTTITKPVEGIQFSTTQKIEDKKTPKTTSTSSTTSTTSTVSTPTKIKKQPIENNANEVNNPVLDDEYTVTTTYSYYISELDTTIVTQNKLEMDRLVAIARAKLKLKDSLKN